jgi:hypothetical protein
LPEDFQPWIVWLEKKVPTELEEIQLSAKNQKKNTEHFSLYPIFLLGVRWDLNKELWPRPEFAKYKLDAVTANSEWDDGDENFSNANRPNIISWMKISSFCSKTSGHFDPECCEFTGTSFDLSSSDQGH